MNINIHYTYAIRRANPHTYRQTCPCKHVFVHALTRSTIHIFRLSLAHPRLCSHFYFLGDISVYQTVVESGGHPTWHPYHWCKSGGKLEHVYVCVYVYIFAFVYICLPVGVQVCECACVSTCMSVYIYMSVCLSVCMPVHVSLCMPVCLFVLIIRVVDPALDDCVCACWYIAICFTNEEFTRDNTCAHVFSAQYINRAANQWLHLHDHHQYVHIATRATF